MQCFCGNADYSLKEAWDYDAEDLGVSDNWGSYFTTIDGNLASVFVDLGLHEQAPMARFGQFLRLSLQMISPRADGLSSSEEAPQLFKFEDVLQAKLKPKLNSLPILAIFVGRITAAKKREFFLYAASADPDSLGLEKVFKAFPQYVIDVKVVDDPTWQGYLSLLPNDEQQQQIEDQKVCEVLVRKGDDLTVARDIDHWIYFDSPDARDLFSSQVALMGFQVRCLLDGKPESGGFGIQIYRSDVPSFSGIGSVTLPLYRLAHSLGGEYDGWETQVV